MAFKGGQSAAMLPQISSPSITAGTIAGDRQGEHGHSGESGGNPSSDDHVHALVVIYVKPAPDRVCRFQHQERVVEISHLRRIDQLQNFAPFVGVIIERKIVVSGKYPERYGSQKECQIQGRRGLNRSGAWGR